jgi:uncharacterized protein YdhG (YjbR/CyaY superfamily)
MPEATESATARIDAHLAALPPDQRDALQALRETIAAAAPEAVEAISYGLPAFKYRGRGLLWFEAFSKHCSLFPGASVHNYAAELEGYTIAKGTVQFTPDHPLPPVLVTRMVQDKMAAIDAMLETKKKA